MSVCQVPGSVTSYFKSRRRVELERARFDSAYKELCSASGNAHLSHLRAST